MAKKAKRLVSESRTQLIDCRRLLHIVLPRAQISPPQHRSDPIVLCEASCKGAGHYFAAGNAQAVIGWRSISLEVDHACIID
jgi:hypothetical protein